MPLLPKLEAIQVCTFDAEQRINCVARGVMGQATASTSAYMDAELVVQGAREGLLSGMNFAVKDMYDVSCQGPLALP